MLNSIMPNSEVVSVLTAEFLTTGQVARLLGCTKKALADMRLKWQGPPFILQKRGVVGYPVESFKRYLRARKESQPRHGARELRWSRASMRPEFAVSR